MPTEGALSLSTHSKDNEACNGDEICISDFKILNINAWGMKGASLKQKRMEAIAVELKKGEYDLYLFQELWMRHDYETIRSSHFRNNIFTRFPLGKSQFTTDHILLLVPLHPVYSSPLCLTAISAVLLCSALHPESTTIS